MSSEYFAQFNNAFNGATTLLFIVVISNFPLQGKFLHLSCRSISDHLFMAVRIGVYRGRVSVMSFFLSFQ